MDEPERDDEMIGRRMRKSTNNRLRKAQSITLSMVLFLGLVLGSGAFAAVDKPALNLGFESGNTGWTNPEGNFTYNSVNASSSSGGYTWNVTGSGTAMAKLQPYANNQNFTTVSNTLGLSADSRSYMVGVFPRITNSSYIYKDITLAAGDEFTMAWNYVAIDYTPFNDASIVTMVNQTDVSKPAMINGRYAETVILGATVPGTANYTTGSYGSTGWQTVRFKATVAGTYRMGFVTFNLDDTSYSPILYVDDTIGTTLLNGSTFTPVGQDPNAPASQPIKGISYDKNYFNESGSNDGSISETLTLTLAEETFTGSNGSTISATVNNLPSGLTATVTKVSSTTATLALSGNAINHSIGDSISNLEVIFPDGAFAGNVAADVLGSTTSDLSIQFNHFSIVYNLNGGTNHGSNPSDYEQNSGTISLQAPTKSGYSFVGWFDAASGGNAVTQISTTAGGTVTLYARWAVTRTITYNLNGGTNDADNPATYIEGVAVTLEPATKTGYYFDGWYNASSGGGLVLSIPESSTGNVTLYARWVSATVVSPPARALSPVVYNFISGIAFTAGEMTGSYGARMTFEVVEKEAASLADLSLIKSYFSTISNEAVQNFILDINLFKSVNSVETPVTETAVPVTISFVVPEGLRDKDFQLIRIHDGVLDVLTYTYDETTHILTFTTDKFSTYSLTYTEGLETLPQTGGYGLVVMAIGLMGIGSATLWTLKRRNR